MQLVGDENRIRALFSEQALEHRCVAPRFDQVWTSALTATRAPIVGRSFVVAAATLAVIITCALALWSRYRMGQPAPPARESVASVPETASSESTTPRAREHKVVSAGPGRSRSRLTKRVVRHRTIERSVIQQAVALSAWQSPTELYLQSPARSPFKSLPQLNQSLKELESFLPNNNVKESKP
jgi:hypothetical protein